MLAKDGNAYEIVDGQQRMTTLMLVVHALLEELAPDDRDRIASEAILLRQGQALNLDFGVNAAFIDQLFGGENPSPESGGQRRLQEAYHFARDRAKALAARGGKNLVKRWLNAIKLLEIIQFVAPDTGRAIRMFQTVNDRGLPLTATDKAKALLVLYSNRYIDGVLDQKINSCFGKLFTAFDFVREFVGEPGFRIDNIARDTFSEDDILRYHYLAYSHSDAIQGGDYDASVRTVFDGFLKGTLKALARDPAKLRAFIDDYVTNLSAFSTAFAELVGETKDNERFYKLFVVLGLSARLYPLAVRLYQRNLLFSATVQSADLLGCLEVCDVRVYKTRGTDPAKDVGELSHVSRTASVGEIECRLRSFVEAFMPDGLFQANLGQDMYHNDAVSLMLLAYDEQIAGTAYPLPDLVRLVKGQVTREHIVVQTPNFSVQSCGFLDETEYQQHLHTLGNLTLLSRSENSRCNNLPVHSKMTEPNLYAASVFNGTRALAHQYALVPKGGTFGKEEILQRTKELSRFVMSTWAIW